MRKLVGTAQQKLQKAGAGPDPLRTQTCQGLEKTLGEMLMLPFLFQSSWTKKIRIITYDSPQELLQDLWANKFSMAT